MLSPILSTNPEANARRKRSIIRASSCCLSVPVPVSPMTRKRTEPSLFGNVSFTGAADAEFPLVRVAESFCALTLANAKRIVTTTEVIVRLMIVFPSVRLGDSVSHVVENQSILAIDEQHIRTDEAIAYLLRQLRKFQK